MCGVGERRLDRHFDVHVISPIIIIITIVIIKEAENWSRWSGRSQARRSVQISSLSHQVSFPLSVWL